MIIEAIVTSGTPPNFAPMGILIEEKSVIIKAFKKTTTYRNLSETKCGVVNITDNVLVFAKSALTDSRFPCLRASQIEGWVLEDACRWYEFIVDDIFFDEERPAFACRIVHEGRRRDFSGFNRGKNAVVEASILATRLSSYEREFIATELEKLDIIVKKTGGPQENEAMEFILGHVRDVYENLGHSEGSPDGKPP